ncbi:hypothetical protein [Flavobacterium sp. 3HN19-14]|uniref:hypothetical protein n=1 Tax=Flavobacterium sp. 3HN19-14 TaxID=3448133 RepID=UPI003EE15BD1
MKQKLLLLTLLFTLNAISQELDPTFGNNGKTVTGFGNNRSSANAAALQPDGKLIVGGSYTSSHGDNDFALVRYNTDGTLDPTFGAGGKVVTDFLEINNDYSYINAVYVLPDGKIMALGTTGKTGFIPSLVVVKYNHDGTLDTAFGTNGKVTNDLFPLDSFGSKLTLLPDGKFVVTSAKTYNGDPNYYFGLRKYTADGQIDETFGTAGEVVTSFGNGKSGPASIALQPDGKLLVAGKFLQSGMQQMAVARYNPDGALDTSFDGDGKVLTNFGGTTSCNAMDVAIKPDGKIIVSGIVYTLVRNFGVVQYNSNGSLDTSFDGDGKATAAFADDYDNISAVTRQPDGKFLVAIKSDNYMLTASDMVLRKFNSDISKDISFGNNGEVSITFGGGLSKAMAAVATPNGAVFLVGESIAADNSTIEFAIAKYINSGSLDVSFGNNGKTTTGFEPTNDQVSKVLISADDSFIAVGISGGRRSNNSYYSNIALAKYDSNGNLDTNFGNSGKVVSVFGDNNNNVTAAIFQPDGKILVGNMYYSVGQASYSNEIIRYNANGILDTSFGTNGKASLAFSAVAMVCQPDGKIVVAGIGSEGNGDGYILQRFNYNGTPDTSFDNDGTAFVSTGNFYIGEIVVLLQPDGKLVVSASASDPELYSGALAYATVRFNANGSLDATFGENGKTTTLIDEVSLAATGFIQPDGKIIIAGRSIGANINFSTVRYNSNGTLDTTYGNNGIASSALSSDYREINDIYLQPDGKFLVAVSLYNQNKMYYDFKIRRFNPDGSYDADFGGIFGVTTSFYNGYDEAFSIGLQSDSKIIVAGATNNGINNDFAISRYTNSLLNVENENSPFSPVICPILLQLF